MPAEQQTATRLKLVLRAGSEITGTETQPGNKRNAETQVSDVLARRLVEFDNILGDGNILREHLKTADNLECHAVIRALSGEELETLTAEVALWVVVEVQGLTNDDISSSAPDLGTRDLNQIRTLASIVFKWGVDRRLSKILSYWKAISPETSPPKSSSQAASIVTVDDSNIATDVSELQNMVRQLLGLIFSASSGETSSLMIHSSHISKTLLTRHPSGLTKACVVLACYTNDQFMKDSTNRLLSILPISQNMISLGAMTSKSMPGKVRAVCGSLLSEQLLRPEGLRGLLGAIFGESDSTDGDVAPLSKLEHVARIVSIIPNRMNKQEYLDVIIPRILEVLGYRPQTHGPPPEVHTRAAAFTLSRVVKAHPDASQTVIQRLIHQPFFKPSKGESEDNSVLPLLQLIQSVLLRLDPSSTLPHSLVTPILPPLYSLLAYLDRVRTSDPALKELVRGILRTWGGCVNVDEAVEGWRDVIQKRDGWGDANELHWEAVGEQIRLCEGREPESIVFLQGNEDIDSDDLLQLRPNPAHLITLLKSIKRDDVNSTLLVRSLNEYQALQALDSDPFRTMLHLKIVMEMVDQLGSTALTQPEHILTFVAVVLEPKPSAAQSGKRHVNRSKTGLGFEDLRIVETEEEDGDSDADSDDEGPDDMLVTALNLLLAVLEAHPSLTPINTQLLQVISDYLEPLSLHQADAVRPLAREARLVLTARKASTSASGASASTQQDDPQTSIQAKYQQGLKLLQDPLLPVRAHGLVILREIVLSLRSGKTPTTTSTLDQALVPSILSISLQMVQEDDSFIFLNAVQGLVAMVDVLGREILKGLVDVYTGGTAEGSLAYSLEKAELDKRVRVGEALGQSIRKCGDALSSYANMIIPPLFRMVRSTHLPTSLRSSALSLLAQCVETSKMAVLPWCSDLCAGILDLLQLESVTTSQTKPDKQKASSSEEDPNSPPKVSSKFDREIMDKQPLSVDPKLAPFRRSALHFLSLLIKSIVEDRVEVNPSPDFGLRPSTFRVAKSTALSEPELMQGVDEYMSQELVGRLRLFLRYMKATDVDDVVRVMAMEVLELVDSLQGLPQGLE